ncbi:MAG: hypothetical protein ACKVX9_05005 [Blastocatellia bacterium]
MKPRLSSLLTLLVFLGFISIGLPDGLEVVAPALLASALLLYALHEAMTTAEAKASREARATA